MLITIKKETEETIEISLPSYYKHGEKFYKIISPTTAIIVSTYDFYHGIVYDEITKGGISLAVEKGEPITEMDFDFAYQMAIDRLQKATTNSEPQKQAV